MVLPDDLPYGKDSTQVECLLFWGPQKDPRMNRQSIHKRMITGWCLSPTIGWFYILLIMGNMVTIWLMMVKKKSGHNQPGLYLYGYIMSNILAGWFISWNIHLYIYICIYIYIWLVVEPYPSEKWWSSSVGMMTFPKYGKITFMFQATNQIT